ncbi:hypothetical protein [uncultured Parolsenella sp.]|uniref:hypothetical protein n=1 Tax=uncultured Parolsenella sp. TaxID=2083008 RepID=UPI0027D98D1B|nr:hypothetical protein [uncultured Parolsenella sp.]
MHTNLHLEDFDRALADLDRRLKDQGCDPIDIHAIGGYAPMFHGLRKLGATADLGTVTPNCLPDVVAPLAGAWIETACRSPRRQTCPVAPLD